MFHFSLRDLLWLTTVIAMGAGWYVDRLAQEAKWRREKSANIEAAVQLQIEWLKRYRGEWPLGGGDSP